jgi:signal transduction histidine kinase
MMARIETDTTWLVDLPPTARQSWSAVAVSAVLVVGFGAAAPFANRPLSELNALFPFLDAVVFVTDLITSVLLFAQLSIFYSTSLLALASGYLFSALIVIPHALTLSGAFLPTGLSGAGVKTGSWLFIFWHAGFATALLAYVLLCEHRSPKSISRAPSREPVLAAIGLSVASMCALVFGLTWLATAGADVLPSLIVGERYLSPFVRYPIGFTIILSMAPLAVLGLRRRSVLDQWLMVVALASILELAFSGLLPSVRFSLGFYAGRVFALATSSIVLIVLLAETTRLYVRLARSNAMLQHHQENKLMNLEALASSITHEIRQPLSAIMLNSEVALELIQREPPDIAEASSALRDTISNGQRTDQVLQSIRALFGKNTGERELVDVNEMARAAVRVLREELDYHGVRVHMELVPQLPRVVDHGQLQEVFINLIRNAMEAMDGVDHNSRVLTVRTGDGEGKAIIAEVEDTGPGIDPENIKRVFDPFVTTKPGGMGLGLAICRMIMDRHGGQLSVSAAQPQGTIFRMVLPLIFDCAGQAGGSSNIAAGSCTQCSGSSASFRP